MMAAEGAVDADDLARAAGEAMWRADRASKWLGMQLEEIRAGYARMSMRVTADMTNGQDYCHGGLIFSLADSSFGFACNSRNQRALAAGCSIEFLAPAQLGDDLTSECREQALAGRTGLYDARVTNQRGVLIALFRGKSATVKGNWIK
jgi:acyl-CoA thioesterase